MRAIVLIVTLCLVAAIASAGTTKVTIKPKPTAPPSFEKVTKQCFIDFLNCYRKVLLNGNKALGIPSHNPFHSPHTYNVTNQLGPLLYHQWSLQSMKWSRLSHFTYHVLEHPTKLKDTSIFNVTFVWPKITVNGVWKRYANFHNIQNVGEGKFGMDLTNRVWKGLVTISRKGVVFKIHSIVGQVKFTVTNMDQEKATLEPYYSTYFRLLYSCDIYSQFLNKYLSEKFTRNWLLKPKRVELLKKSCPRTGKLG